VVTDTGEAVASIDIKMAQLLVRGLGPDLVSRLKKRAAEHGVSAEEEHRRILRAALSDDSDLAFADHLLGMPDVGEDFLFERTREYPADFPRDVEL
jgi:plasmid stability protein